MNASKRTLFDEKTDELLEKAESMIPDEVLPDLPFLELAPDVHDWYKFEHDLWNIGEELRQLALEHGKYFNPKQIGRIIAICQDCRAKRGRQSFVLLLGKKVYGKYAEEIVSLLNDTDVEGHVICTLYKMGAGQYTHLVRPFLNHKRTWIKNDAKRYIAKFDLTLVE